MTAFGEAAVARNMALGKCFTDVVELPASGVRSIVRYVKQAELAGHRENRMSNSAREGPQASESGQNVAVAPHCRGVTEKRSDGGPLGRQLIPGEGQIGLVIPRRLRGGL
jgi:hypothetical protein